MNSNIFILAKKAKSKIHSLVKEQVNILKSIRKLGNNNSKLKTNVNHVP